MNKIITIIMIVLLLAIVGCKREAKEAAPIQPMPEQPAEGIEAPETAESMEQETEAKLAVPSAANVEILKEETTSGRTYEERSFEAETDISGITCSIDEQKIGFTFTNNDGVDYTLEYIKFGEERDEMELSLEVNGRRIKNTMEACGTNLVKEGESVTCTVDTVIRTGESTFGKELINYVEASRAAKQSKIAFRCS